MLTTPPGCQSNIPSQECKMHSVCVCVRTLKSTNATTTRMCLFKVCECVCVCACLCVGMQTVAVKFWQTLRSNPSQISHYLLQLLVTSFHRSCCIASVVFTTISNNYPKTATILCLTVYSNTFFKVLFRFTMEFFQFFTD